MMANDDGDFELCYAMDGLYRVVIESPRGGVLVSEADIAVGSSLEQGIIRGFRSPLEILEDRLLSYTENTGRIHVEPGQFVKTALGSFTYQIASDNAECPHLTTAGGVHLYCLPTQQGEITLRQVGGPEEGDITTSLQHAVMVASFGNNGDPIAGGVLVDVHEATLSDTVHLHYGYNLAGNGQFRGIRLRGLGRPYAMGEHNMGTRLFCTMTDRPAFVIQNGRYSEISGMKIIGVARDELRNRGTTAIPEDGIDIRSEAIWDTALTNSGVTPGRRYAPHAAIAIDPYSGPEPATSYPAWTLHPWFSASPAQYGHSGGSSETLLHALDIDGWEVGVVQQPGDKSANSDFLTMRDISFFNCKYADSGGSSQSRNTTRTNCGYNTIWCVTTNRLHGQQIGTAAGSFNNCSGAGFIRMLFDLERPFLRRRFDFQ